MMNDFTYVSEEDNEQDNEFKEIVHNEQRFLSIICDDYERVKEVRSVVSAADLVDARHKLIYEAILSIIDESSSPNQPVPKKVVLSQNSLMLYLNKYQKLEAAGGFEYLSMLFLNNMENDHLDKYTNNIIDVRIRESLRNISAQIFKVSTDQNSNINQALEETKRMLENLINRKTNFINLDETTLYSNMIKALESLASNSDDSQVLKTDFEQFNQCTNGLKSGNLIIIAGRPAMGKSTFAMNLCEQIARQKNSAPVIVFSLEMPSEQIALRSLSAIGTIEQSEFKKDQLSEMTFDAASKVLNEFKDKQNSLYLSDHYSLTIDQMHSTIRNIKKENNGISLIMVDYLQLIRTGRKLDRHLEIAYITGSLKAMAREYNVPIIALSQLNRDVDKRGPSGRPTNSDLRESGSIEQDADIVIMIHRPEVNADKKDVEALKGVAEVIITKNRQGQIGTLTYKFEGQYSRFIEDQSKPFKPS